MFRWLALPLFLYSLTSLSQPLPSKVRFAAADWCPYTCADGSGIISDYLREVLATANIELEVLVIPWSRALHEARFGHIDGLLTLVPGEAQNILMPTTPTMTYQDCFYQRADNTWRYQGVPSLQQQVLGVVQDYSYNPALDDYIATARVGQVHTMSGSQPSQRLITMLMRERVDVYLDDFRVSAHAMRQMGVDVEFNSGGCLPAKPLYLGVSAQPAWAMTLVSWLNQALERKDNQQRLHAIIERYHQSVSSAE
jgi:polar amino acid transport system substrate-binding protein